jgi:DNA-binding XRE family transcriptional regulator
MNQTQLSERSGVPYKTINDRINNRDNRTMSLKNAKNIAEVLGCNAEDLYEWEYTKR